MTYRNWKNHSDIWFSMSKGLNNLKGWGRYSNDVKPTCFILYFYHRVVPCQRLPLVKMSTETYKHKLMPYTTDSLWHKYQINANYLTYMSIHQVCTSGFTLYLESEFRTKPWLFQTATKYWLGKYIFRAYRLCCNLNVMLKRNLYKRKLE